MNPLSGLGLNRKPHREVIELQLTALIDVFSMIVIFLILGSIFGADDLSLGDLRIPKSFSHEVSGANATVKIEGSKVSWSGSPDSLPLSTFRDASPESRAKLDSLRAAISESLKRLESGSPSMERRKALNLIADERAPYQDLFDVLRFFREAGYTNVLFVATSEKGAPR